MKIKIPRPNVRKNIRQTYSPALRLALVSLLICGLVFPLVVTGLAQLVFPSQANGSMVHLNNRNVGSDLIAQQFTQPFFFHPRNDSASHVDPDITLEDAYSQTPRITSATGIPTSDLRALVDQNVEGTWWIFGKSYVNVLRLNLALIDNYPNVYPGYQQGY